MEDIQKQVYEEPSSKVVEVEFRAVICASPAYHGFGDEEDM